MACSAENRLRVLIRDEPPPLALSSLQGHQDGHFVHVGLVELITEVRTLLNRSRCYGGDKCTYCGRLGRHWPSLKLEIGSTVAVNGAKPPGIKGILTTCWNLTIEKHFRASLGSSTKSLQVWSYGYSDPELWQALGQWIHRIQLSSVPSALPLLSNLEVLELRGERHAYQEDKDGSSVSSLGGEDNEASVLQAPLFLSDELGMLTSHLNSKSSCLQILDLKQCSFENLSFGVFFQTIANSVLVDVSLKECDFITLGQQPTQDALFVDNLSASSSCQLQHLTVQECLLGEDALGCLCQLLTRARHLEHLVFVRNDCPLDSGEKVAGSLLNHADLQILDLSGLDGGESAIKAIGHLLEQSPRRLKRLILVENPQVLDVTPLAQAIFRNTSLIALDLSLNRLMNMGSLTGALQVNRTLESLNVSNVTFLDYDEESGSNESESTSPPYSFMANLGETKGLKFLDLSNVQLPDDCMKALAESIRHNTSLETVQLNDLDRSIAPVSLASFFAGVHDNRTLKALEVGRNPLTKHDIEALVSALENNHSLESLTLCGCDLTDDLLLPLATRLPGLHMVDLDLSFNAIGKVGVTALLEGLQLNRRIRSIAIYNSCWSIGGPTHFECDGFAEENNQIQALLQQHRLSAWPFRLEKYKDEPDNIHQVLREEICLELAP